MGKIIQKSCLIAVFCLSFFTVGAQDFEKEQVQIDVGIGKLTGELMRPKGSSDGPVMVIIQGSGPTDMDGNMGPTLVNNSLLKLAELLADNGISSLRFDKRGQGKSASARLPEVKMTLDILVADVELWIHYLKEDREYQNIGIIGHDQGALIGNIAALNNEISLFVAIAATSFSLDQVFDRNMVKNRQPDSLRQQIGKVFSELKSNESTVDVPRYMREMFRPTVQPFLRSWLKYDPLKEIGRLDIPTLIVHGGADLQVSLEEGELLSQSAKNAQFAHVKGMNHILKPADDIMVEHNLETYGMPDLPLHKEFCESLIKFLLSEL